jgi:DUF971 family protein
MPTPARIHGDRAAGTLEIDWDDGHRSVYGTVELRWLCPCAHCRGEAGMPGWLDSGPTLTAEQTRAIICDNAAELYGIDLASLPVGGDALAGTAA